MAGMTPSTPSKQADVLRSLPPNITGEESHARGMVSEAITHPQWLVHVVWIDPKQPASKRIHHRLVRHDFPHVDLRTVQEKLAAMIEPPQAQAIEPTQTLTEEEPDGSNPPDA